jgi:hypothetical protein
MRQQLKTVISLCTILVLNGNSMLMEQFVNNHSTMKRNVSGLDIAMNGVAAVSSTSTSNGKQNGELKHEVWSFEQR